MLTQLSIKNFAIIDELEIVFKDSLTVLTGETGAGKSIIVDALDFLLGSRANSDLIKTGTNKTLVEGIFFAGEDNYPHLRDWFEKNGFDPGENNTISVSRELTPQGSKARVNGSLANISHLLYLREFILNIHQQSEHIELLKIEKQLQIVDSFGSELHKNLIEDYKKTYEEYQVLKNNLHNYLENSASYAKKLDLLKFETDEIKEANIQDINEEEKLVEKREILLNKQEIIENSNLIYELTNGDNPNNITSVLTQIKKLIANSSKYDKSFEPYLEIIENNYEQIKDLSSFVKQYLENIDTNDNDLNNIEDRLDLFYNLKRKYGKTLAEIKEYFKKIQAELHELENMNTSQEEIEKSFKQKDKEINLVADKVTKSRENITRDFVNKINEELKTLGFNDVLFVVEFTPCDLSSFGKEQIQFLFSANPDEPPKPLLKVASGGELSRIMLAIKSTICRGLPRQTPTTMVFDEIDIGVSGEIAASVAKKLYKISGENQVICITHQPIICAMADSHFVIEKNIKDGFTEVTVKEIKPNERIEALATLLTPEKKLKEGITEDAKQFAKSLLENAKNIKEKMKHQLQPIKL